MRPAVAVAENVALLNSAPEWQLAHLLLNVPRPDCWLAVSAFLLPSRKRSNGESSETSVDSYRLIARPQNSEKFASIIEHWLGLSAPTELTPGITASAPSMTAVEFHHLSWNAARTMSAYVVARPVPPDTADAAARVLVMNDLGECVQTRIALDNASLASQAVGPPNNGTEMSANGRDWLKLGKKMLSLRPLDGQKVMGDDSVLGAMAVSGGTGLATTYADMVRAAFQDKWWNSTAVVDGALAVIPGVSSGGALSPSQYSMMEANFSLFWGLAINLYESTLVSDDSPFDRFLDGNKNALTA